MSEVGNLAIKLSLDSGTFERSMKSIDRNLKAMGQEMRINQNRGKEWGNSITGLTTKQESLTRMLTSQEVKVRQLRDAYERSKAETGENSRATENLATQLNRATAEYTRTETELNQVSAALRRQQDELRLSQSGWTQLGERMQAVGASMKKVGDSMTKVGKDLSMKVTAPIALMGAGIVKAGMDFEAGMSKVAAVSGATGADLEALKAQAKELGSSTSFSASQAAEGMEKLALAGWKSQEIMSAMPGMLNLAAAGALSLSEAADITSDVMSAFGLGAENAAHAADVFAYAQANANTNVQQAGEAMTYLAPVANALGWELEESAAAIMKLADSGVKGSMAGQAFATSLSRLAKPTKAMRKEMSRLGMDFFDAEGNMKSLPDVMKEVENGTKGMTKEQKSSTLSILFGAEAYKHWAILLESGSAELAKTTEELKNADGAAAKMAETMLDNTKGSLVAFQSAVEGLAIKLSEFLLPTVTKILDKLTEWARVFTDASPSTQKLVLAIAGIAAAIGPVLVVMGVLVSSIGSILTALGTASAAIGVMTTGVASAVPAVSALAGVFTVLTGPIGIAVAAIAAIGVGVGLLANHLSKDAIPEVDRFGEGVSKATQEALGGFFALSDDATKSLNQLSWSSAEVTNEMKVSLVGKYEEMNKQILDAMNARHSEQIESMTTFFGKSSALTDEEEAAILLKQQSANEAQVIAQQDKEARIKEILTAASTEKRALTEAESAEINAIQKSMTETAVVYLSESQVEQKIIMEQMKNNAGELTATMAADVVKNSVKQRDGAVKEAESQYKDTMAEIIRMRDEAGVITAEQADKMIEEAKRTKEQTVTEATDMHKQVVKEAQLQADEHVDKVNWETGEVLSKWEVFKNDMKAEFEKFKGTIADIWEGMKEAWSSTIEWIKTTWSTVALFFSQLWTDIKLAAVSVWDSVVEAWNLSIEFIKETWSSIKLFFIELWMSVVETVMAILQPFIDNIINVFNGMKDGVATVFEGLSLYFTGVWEVIKNIFLGALLLLINLVTGNFEELKSNATQIMDNIKTAMFDIWEGIKLIFSGALDAVVGFAKAAWDNLKNDTTSAFNALKSFIGTVWESIKLAFNTTVTAIVNFAKQSWENIKSATSTIFNATKTLFSTIWSSTKTFFTTTLSDMLTTAKQKFDDIKNSVKTKMDEAKNNVINKWKEAQTYLTNIDLRQIGKDIIQGLIIGIKSKIEDVKNAIKDVTDAITGKVQDILQIKSPSRVFIQIGKWISEGWAKGIELLGGKVVDAVSDIAHTSLDIAEHYVAEEAKMREKMNSEIAQIEKRAAEDIAKIQNAAYAKKRKTNEQENIKIRRIQEDADKKMKDLRAKTTKEILQLESKMYKDILEETKLYINDKKSLDQLSLTDEARIWEETLKLFSDGSKEKVAAQKEYQKATEAVNKEVVSINKEYSDQMQKINDDLAKSEHALNDEYNKAYSSRVDAIRNFAGLFDEFVAKTDKSGQDLLRNLQSQVTGLEDWRGTLDSLWGKIDDQALMEELEALGPKAAGELAALNSLSEEELAQYVALYNQKFALAREQAEAELVGMKIDTETEITELRKVANAKLGELQRDWTTRIKAITETTNDEFKSLTGIGKQAGQNLLDGLASMEKSLVDKARSIAAAVNAALQSTLGGSVDVPMMASANGFSGGYAGGVTNDNSRSMVNHVVIHSNDTNAVRDTERMLRRLAYQLN